MMEYSFKITEPFLKRLSDVPFTELLKIEGLRVGHRINRIYLGSDFCPVFFCSFLDDNKSRLIMDSAKSAGIPITLCVPVLNENNLQKAKELIEHICSLQAVDEITVNDIGLLDWVCKTNIFNNKKVNLGRLFFKDTRDIRCPELSSRSKYPAILDNPEIFKPFLDRIHFAELDPVPGYDYSVVPLFDVAVNQPFCFQTTGNICLYASMNYSAEKKFRPNSDCNMECSTVQEDYRDGDVHLIRAGKAILFENRIDKILQKKVKRIIWCDYEYISSSE